jgi:hypothetical protein
MTSGRLESSPGRIRRDIGLRAPRFSIGTAPRFSIGVHSPVGVVGRSREPVQLIPRRLICPSMMW